ncbi:LysR family transcriptional regulator, partial [Pseudomonas protegens]|nr:LysR family transcriptional regulator [Pseudomonas protegens]
ARQRVMGKAERWLKERLLRQKVYEVDRRGQSTTW